MNIGVNSTGQKIFPGRVDDPGSSGNDEVFADHPDRVVFHVDVDLSRSIVVDHGPVLDQQAVLSALQVDRYFFHRRRLV